MLLELPDDSTWHPSERRKGCYCSYSEGVDNRLSGQEEPVVQGQKWHEKVGGPGCALCRVQGQHSYPGVWGDEEGDLRPPKPPPGGTTDRLGLKQRGLSAALKLKDKD